MSKEKQIELLEKQLAFWKHHCAELSKEITKEEEIANHYAEMLDKTEEELYAERAKSEWISVDERLPENGTKCLVYTNRGEWLDKIEITHYNEGFYIKYCVVTHWMPLPEPPKKGGE